MVITGEREYLDVRFPRYLLILIDGQMSEGVDRLVVFFARSVWVCLLRYYAIPFMKQETHLRNHMNGASGAVIACSKKGAVRFFSFSYWVGLTSQAY